MTISFSQLGNHGRLANQLFQVMSTLGMAEKYETAAFFPEWQYEKYFNYPLLHESKTLSRTIVKEEHFHHYDWKLTGDCDLFGYLQSEKYFPIQNPLIFNTNFLLSVQSKMPEGMLKKETILIHMRRGDYVGNPHYYQLPIVYYIDALVTNFPNWQDSNIVVISDDLPYCKTHFECLPNVYFADGLDEIESMALASLCDHFILSNSSYSWWCAWLGEKPHSKIIHPGHMFAGNLMGNDTKDYWPERWTSFKKESYKLDLKDLTFTIPVFHDHKDRKQNLDLGVCILQSNFETNIIIGEQGSNKFRYMSEWCSYTHFPGMKKFHRTRMLNQMAMQAETPFIANWDADVVIPPMQIYLAVLNLREGQDMVFPYDGRFARLPREPWFRKIQSAIDIGIISGIDLKGKRGRAVPENSVGGAVFFNKKSFIAGGMENEYMISFGPEDCERNDRFTCLGFDIGRVAGCLYHIDHWCGPDSSKLNPHFKANHKELDKIRSLDKDGLRLYINTWEWRPAKISDSEVMEILEKYCEWAGAITGLNYTVKTSKQDLPAELINY